MYEARLTSLLWTDAENWECRKAGDFGKYPFQECCDDVGIGKVRFVIMYVLVKLAFASATQNDGRRVLFDVLTDASTGTPCAARLGFGCDRHTQVALTAFFDMDVARYSTTQAFRYEENYIAQWNEGNLNGIFQYCSK